MKKIRYYFLFGTIFILASIYTNMTSSTANYSIRFSENQCTTPNVQVPIVPGHVQWAGFYNLPLNENLFVPQMFTNYVQQLQGAGNIILINALSSQNYSLLKSKSLIPSNSYVSSREMLSDQIIKIKKAGMKISLNVDAYLFALDPMKMQLSTLPYNDVQSRLLDLKSLVNSLGAKIDLIYVKDEPFWNGFKTGLNNKVVYESLAIVSKKIKTYFPNSLTASVEAWTMIDKDFKMPPGIDLVGIDCYGSFLNCGGVNAYHNNKFETKSIPEYYSILKANLEFNQKLIAVPDASSGNHSNLTESQLLESGQSYLRWVSTEPLVKAIFPFVYSSPFQLTNNSENIVALNKKCALSSFWRRYFSQISQVAISSEIKPNSVPEIIVHQQNPGNVFLTEVTSPQQDFTSANLNAAEKIWVEVLQSRYNSPKSISVVITLPDGTTSEYFNEVGIINVLDKNIFSKGPVRFDFLNEKKQIINTRFLNEKAFLNINCTTEIMEGQTASCSAEVMGLVSGYWLINGVRYSQFDNKTSFQYPNVPKGIYQVQAVGQTVKGYEIRSNVLKVNAK